MQDSSSQDGLTEMVVESGIREKNPSYNEPYDGMRQETNSSSIRNSEASAKRDAQFGHLSSSSESDLLDVSFSDIMKSNMKKPLASQETHHSQFVGGGSESSDGMLQVQGERGSYKEKGRQMDPAFLGFKVTNNRSMMGEIHRLED